MAINKNFVIKNGAEINTKLFVADSTTQKIGIGTTTPSYDLHVFGAAGNGGIGATFVNVTGITTTQALNVLGVSTFNTGPILVARGELTGTSSQSLQVGTATTVSGVYVSGNIGVGQTLPNAKLEVVPTASGIAGLFSGTTSADLVRITQLGSGNALVVEDSSNPDSTSVVVSGLGSVGIGTSFPRFLLDVDVTTSTGTTAVYVRGDVKITGDLSVDDLILDQASLTTLEVTGFSTLGSLSAANARFAGITTGINAPGISTLGFVSGTLANFTGISTIGFINGTTLNVTGFSTLGSLSAGNVVLAGVTTGLNVPGINTLGFIQSNTVNVSGFSTLGSISAGNVILAGIVTGLNAPGISTFGDISVSDLLIAGITTGLNASGISTLTSVEGVSANFSGISTLASITATNISVAGVTTITGGLNASEGAELARLRVTGITTLASATATSVVVGSATTITAGGIDAGSGIVTARQLSQYRALVGAVSSATETFTVTVANKTSNHRYFGTGSSQGYFIDDKESPFITLVPGKTYRFDQADSTNSNHPLRFYLDVNKVTQFTNNVTTNGTAGSAGAYTEITIIDATPIVLHYQCSVHSNMGNAVSNYSNFIDTPYQITARSGVSVTGVVTATSFTGDGANLTNTGATLSAGSGAQRVVLTSLTSGVMTTAATDAELSYNSTTDTLSATNLVVSGNISVGGTVTSMDVTNIDSVGIITAQQGLQVLANGINIIGVSTLSDGVNASQGADLARLRVTGISTLGQTNTTGLSNAGVSTLGDATGSTLVVSGFSTFSGGASATLLSVSGFSTFSGGASATLLNVSGVTTVGVVTGATSIQATNFYGNGNGLTSLNSSQLTGALPALDGSALTGITVGQISGSGIVIQEEGTSIGTAGTINFVGLGVTATFSAGFATVSITATGGDVESTWRTYTAGIATAKSVGVNTTNLDDSDLTGIGNSFQGLYIGNGMLIVDNQLNGNHYIGTNFNGLMAGPVTINGTLTVDGNYVVV